MSLRAAEGSVMRLDRHDSGRISLHDFTVLFDTYTGKPNRLKTVSFCNWAKNRYEFFE
jgi:hypothetical protein